MVLPPTSHHRRSVPSRPCAAIDANTAAPDTVLELEGLGDQDQVARVLDLVEDVPKQKAHDGECQRFQLSRSAHAIRVARQAYHPVERRIL